MASYGATEGSTEPPPSPPGCHCPGITSCRRAVRTVTTGTSSSLPACSVTRRTTGTSTRQRSGVSLDGLIPDQLVALRRPYVQRLKIATRSSGQSRSLDLEVGSAPSALMPQSARSGCRRFGTLFVSGARPEQSLLHELATVVITWMNTPRTASSASVASAGSSPSSSNSISSPSVSQPVTTELWADPYASEPMLTVMELRLDRNELYALLSALEQDLRTAIREDLLHGSDPEQVLGSAFERADTRWQELDDEDLVDTDIVDFLDLGDELEVLFRCRDQLPSDLATALHAHSQQLFALISIRNRVMHARPLTPGDMELAQSTLAALQAAGFNGEHLSNSLALVVTGRLSATLSRDQLLDTNSIMNNLPFPILKRPAWWADKRTCRNFTKPFLNYRPVGFRSSRWWVQEASGRRHWCSNPFTTM